jgi:hypothetical protein
MEVTETDLTPFPGAMQTLYACFATDFCQQQCLG